MSKHQVGNPLYPASEASPPGELSLSTIRGQYVTMACVEEVLLRVLTSPKPTGYARASLDTTQNVSPNGTVLAQPTEHRTR